ncbi:MAG: hypothetical protein BWY31_03874 [Lentisphaerae bacterium ADurb.Bin242]|nr:MAG: hypothetical protein BWY31_03874 [Lentisphaerae bacterium ADurb.Bin242]
MSLSSNIRAGATYVEVTAETSRLQRNLALAREQLQDFGRACTSIGKDLLMGKTVPFTNGTVFLFKISLEIPF